MRKIDKNPFPFAVWPMQKKPVVYSYEELLRKAPTSNLEGFTDEERQALTSGRFAMRTPPPAAPAVNVPEHFIDDDEDDYIHEDDDELATMLDDYINNYDDEDDYISNYTEDVADTFDPWEGREGLSDSDPRNPTAALMSRRPRRHGIRHGQIPLVNGQAAIFLVPPESERAVNAVRMNFAALRGERMQLEHQGLLTDGKEYLQNAMLGSQHAFEIAKEYANWQANGRGPLPDLSRYERPVVRRKDGSNWEYSPELFDPKNPNSFHPNNVWKFYDDLVKNPAAPGEYISPRIKNLTQKIQDQKNGTYGSLARFPLPPMVGEFARRGIKHRSMTMVPPRSNEQPVEVQNADEMISAINPVKKSWFAFSMHPAIKQP